MSRKYFGTDGIRGRVGERADDAGLRAASSAGPRARCSAATPARAWCIGKDTRRSGYMFESALEAGFAAAGVEVDLLGPLPTPGVAYLTRALRAQAGVVISASHNPHHDNGVKFFGRRRRQAAATRSKPRSKRCWTQPLRLRAAGAARPRTAHRRRAGSLHRVLQEHASGDADACTGCTIVVDCAHGAAYKVGAGGVRGTGRRRHVIGDRRTASTSIDGCGSTHLDVLQGGGARARRRPRHRARRRRRPLPDGRRATAATSTATRFSSSSPARARSRAAQGPGGRHADVQPGPGAGAARALGIAFERAKVGDRYVLELLQGDAAASSAARPRVTRCAWIAPPPATASSPRCRCWRRWCGRAADLARAARRHAASFRRC